jgi:SAM-dependent methyltransferase
MKFRMYLETDLNRVFTKSLGAIAAAELDVILRHRLGATETRISEVDEGRTSYLQFEYDGEQEPLLEQLGLLSATAAAFVEHSASSLEPLPLREQFAFGTEVVTSQRYKGKTSERLTRLMLNVARAADASKAADDRSVLDPMCGRGTTLNWALLYGARATGLDVDRRSLDDYATFLEHWAKSNRYPHKMQRYRKQNSECRHFDFTVAVDRAAFADKTVPDIRTFNAPADSATVAVGRHAMVVSDLPYGIQHQARSDGNRTPTSVGDLVENVAARWSSQLRTGGSVALSWNTKTLSAGDMAALLDRAGFEVVATRGFEHQVDRTITRDVFLANRSNRA